MVLPKNKIEVLRLDHVSQHYAQHVSPHHSCNKRLDMICYHCYELLKLKIRGRKEFHAKKKWKPNATSTCSKAHTEHIGSSSKGWWNMNFNNSKHNVTNNGKVLMKKFLSEEVIRSFQGLKIDKENTLKKQRPTKMSDKMLQHHTHDSKSSHEDCIIKGKVDA
ncbi:unnamed protein product [Vicia faba]|uniref:Uncharacterized protein n=1 Tax=Vicia faba TaxID=3906 RepID=A0AAV0YN97_VICFA|nr:unnamed protein product [Vicia faba]